MQPDPEDQRLTNIGLTARLGYLGHVEQAHLEAWMERLSVVLAYGESWLTPARPDVDPPILDASDLYRELENQGCPLLISLQKEIGKEPLLAVAVLLHIDQRKRDAAISFFGMLRGFREAQIARRAASSRLKQRASMAAANASRLQGPAMRADKVIDDAQRIAATGRDRREIAGIVARLNRLSESQVRRIFRARGWPAFAASSRSAIPES